MMMMMMTKMMMMMMTKMMMMDGDDVYLGPTVAVQGTWPKKRVPWEQHEEEGSSPVGML